MRKSKIKIVLTGGHGATTAISVIEELQKQKNYWEIYWIGAKTAIEGKRIETLESKIFPQLGVITYSINAGKIQRNLNFWAIVSLFKIPLGFIEAFILINKIRPKVILSFGGFAGFPVIVAGFLLKIPSILHEQTVAVGLANKLSSYFVKKIAIAWPESSQFFPREKIVLTGNPVMKSLVSFPKKNKIGVPPTLLIIGGSRGSQTINRAIDEKLEDFLINFNVIHQTGDLDFDHFTKRKDQLKSYLKEKYFVTSFIDPLKINEFYSKSDIIISRSGANTISELLIIQRPAIVIPIPWARYDEQTKNAKLLEKAGIAKIIEQSALTGDSLLKEAVKIRDNYSYMLKNIKAPKLNPNQTPQAKIAILIKKLL
jgi:UDP-N-acetylglucosamine--N-acetylmuramyl-(pentapeptide) pyrophosphoryl-undecaprenol N-acetylglucosamine transferase